jgi:hypothetical protein
MLYSEMIAVCSEIHTKHINTLCRQNVELLNVKPGGTYSNHWVLNVWSIHTTSYKTNSLMLSLSSVSRWTGTEKASVFITLHCKRILIKFVMT